MRCTVRSPRSPNEAERRHGTWWHLSTPNLREGEGGRGRASSSLTPTASNGLANFILAERNYEFFKKYWTCLLVELLGQPNSCLLNVWSLSLRRLRTFDLLFLFNSRIKTPMSYRRRMRISSTGVSLTNHVRVVVAGRAAATCGLLRHSGQRDRDWRSCRAIGRSSSLRKHADADDDEEEDNITCNPIQVPNNSFGDSRKSPPVIIRGVNVLCCVSCIVAHN